ncbi:MAG: hypothetical protein JOZ72_06415 [Alphaproteobacteria bacterium]|nr:hypothetical protein [Alphaproteobacteria bacterium]
MLRVLAIAIAVAFLNMSATADALHYRSVYVFNDLTDGWNPVIVGKDKNGDLVGYTNLGGSSTVCGYGCGTVFKLTPDGTKTVLHTFDSADGAAPSGMTIADDGTLYGTTEAGSGGFGSIFKIAPDGQFSTVFWFPGKMAHHQLEVPDGWKPDGGVIVGHDGNLYGTASYGGINNHCGEGGCGTVFKVTPSGEFTLLHAFGGEDADGCHPYSGVVQDAQGFLYGTTNGCGHINLGTVYKTDPATGATTTLHSFLDPSDGNGPSGPVTLDEAGNVYGLTAQGGGNCNGGVGCGTIYKIAPDGTETLIYVFKSFYQGYNPMGPLYRDHRGNLYGVTYFGGPSSKFSCISLGCGTAFKLKPGGAMILLHNFTGTPFDSSNPVSGLTPGPQPHGFYGSSRNAGDKTCCGAVYELTP